MPRERRTKIVATLGPASESRGVLGRMLAAGLNVARVNFSHGAYEDHRRRVELLRSLAAARGVPVAILADLQGPKIRVGNTPDGKPIALRKGDALTIVTVGGVSRPRSPGGGDPRESRAEARSYTIPTPFRRLSRDCRPGDRILFGDGLLEVVVRDVRPGRVACAARTSGVLRPHQGMNLPGARLATAALTPKDVRDLAFAVRLGADYVALSFVRRAADVVGLRRRLDRLGARTPIIAKIEKPEALGDLDGILRAADGIMVARGDLGVELSPEKVPVVQKHLIAAANRRGLTVITATQMLESMLASPRPTRAEASDVANAVLDGTDAVMLSGETAVGQYPVESVAMMAAIAREAEAAPEYAAAPVIEDPGEGNHTYAVARAACEAARPSRARAILVFTLFGRTAWLVSKFRPALPIFALTPDPRTVARLALDWGVTPVLMPLSRSTDEMIALGERALLRGGRLRRGDVVIVIGGLTRHRGATDMMKVLRVGGRT